MSEADVTEAKETKERETFTLDDGTEGSRSAYIRQEFMKDRSRGEIAKELEVSYSIVYAATVNMYNAVHKEGEGGRGGRGVIMEDGRSRADHMRDLFKEGVSRGEIAKMFDAPYATVYAATKDVEPPEGTAKAGRKVLIDGELAEELGIEEGTPRADYIRKRFYEDGLTRREIANELKCDYAVVWAATKPEKDEEDDEAEDVPEDNEEMLDDVEGEDVDVDVEDK